MPKAVTRTRYWFHRFYPGQPDLNYREPAVADEMRDTTRFWLEKGVDGFRCDVVSLLYETASSCSLVPETVDCIRSIRKIVDGFPDRAMVAEPVELSNATPYFGSGADMFHMAFDFAYGYFWGLAFASGDRRGIEEAMATASGFPGGRVVLGDGKLSVSGGTIKVKLGPNGYAIFQLR